MNKLGKIEISLITLGMLLSAFFIQGAMDDPHLSELLDGPVYSVSSQTDGKIIIAGDFSEGKVFRVNPDKTVDWNYMKDLETGQFNRGVKKVKVLSDNSLIAAGEFTNFDQSLVGYIAKLNPNGILNNQFAKNSGVGFDDIVRDMVIQEDGKIILVGDFTSYNGQRVNHIARIHPDGRLDEFFNIGEGFDGPAHKIKISKTGDVLFVAGEFQTFNKVLSKRFVRLPASSL